MLAEITAGYQATKATIDIARGIHALKSEAEVNSAVIEIQRLTIDAQHSLMAAQERHTAMSAQIGDLEKEVARLKIWSTERDKYALRAVDTHGFAYMRKEGFEEGEPPHWLCVQCFDDGSKSVLQKQSENGPHATHRCNRCSSTITIGIHRYPGDDFQ